jgi:predicted nucleic acid-binding protein
MPVLVDTCGWIEYFTSGKRLDKYKAVLERDPALVVPTVCLYEAYKRLAPFVPGSHALDYAGVMMKRTVVNLDAKIALAAAEHSLAHHIPMADAMILATATAAHAELWTHDEHLRGLPGVRFIE